MLSVQEKKRNVAALQLGWIRDRIMIAAPELRALPHVLKESELEYRRFLLLASAHEDANPQEGSFVDQFWRAHREEAGYSANCLASVGVVPTRTGTSSPALAEYYQGLFGRPLPPHWKASNVVFLDHCPTGIPMGFSESPA
jgi:hypothetical protein